MPDHLETLLLDVDSTCQLLGLPRRTLYSLMSRGALPPSFRLGKKRVFRRQDLEKWVSMGMPSLEKFLVLAGGSQ
jgi:excisionase family DNA binding protein